MNASGVIFYLVLGAGALLWLINNQTDLIQGDSFSIQEVAASDGVSVRGDKISPALRVLNRLEQHPFDRDVVLESAEELQRIYEQDPDDVWVYLGLARVYLTTGYRSGSSTKAGVRSFILNLK